MQKFKDKNGAEWEIVIDVRQAGRVRDAVKVELFSIYDHEAKRLFTDPVLLVKTLEVLCQEQIKARHMTSDDFSAVFNGDALEAAADAMLEDVLNMVPSARQTTIRAALAKSRELGGQAQLKALTAIAALTLDDVVNSATPTVPPVDRTPPKRAEAGQ